MPTFVNYFSLLVLISMYVVTYRVLFHRKPSKEPFGPVANFFINIFGITVSIAIVCMFLIIRGHLGSN